MTLLATYQTHGLPVLVGDALVTLAGSPSSLRKKVYIVGPNLVIGWTGYLRTARVVVFELLSRFWGKRVDVSSLESTLCNLSFPGMSEFEVKIVGCIVDSQPRSFIWQSAYSKEVFYNDYYFEGSGEKYFESVLRFHVLSGGDPPRPPHKFSDEIAAVQSTLVYCGQAFFDEVLAFENWNETFGFAYEVLVYAYEKFWPLGPTVYVGWEYRWDPASQTGRAILSPFIARMNFRQHYSILQKATHENLVIQSCRNYPIRPIYDYVINEDLSKVRFDINADHYVHYFVLHPPIDQFVPKLCYVCGRTQTGDKVTLTFEKGRPKFEVNTSRLDQMFREAIDAVTISNGVPPKK